MEGRGGRREEERSTWRGFCLASVFFFLLLLFPLFLWAGKTCRHYQRNSSFKRCASCVLWFVSDLACLFPFFLELPSFFASDWLLVRSSSVLETRVFDVDSKPLSQRAKPQQKRGYATTLRQWTCSGASTCNVAMYITINERLSRVKQRKRDTSVTMRARPPHLSRKLKANSMFICKIFRFYC